MKEYIEIYIDVNNKLILSDFLDYSYDTYSFSINILTNKLSYKSEMYASNLKSNIVDLEMMDNELKGSTVIREEFMNSYIKLEVTTLGHVMIEVFILEIESNNEIRVFFQTDQTILKYMSNLLKNIALY